LQISFSNAPLGPVPQSEDKLGEWNKKNEWKYVRNKIEIKGTFWREIEKIRGEGWEEIGEK